jgi:WD40 repeat protein
VICYADEQSAGGGHSDTVRGLAWVDVGSSPKILSAGFDGAVMIWAVSSDSGDISMQGRLVDRGCSECAPCDRAHQDAVTALVGASFAGMPTVATASEDGVIKVWDIQQSDISRYLGGTQRGVSSLAWLNQPQEPMQPDAVWLASGSGDSTIIVHDVATGAQLQVLRGHTAAVHSLVWLQSMRWLLSGSSDGTARVWRIRSATA